MVLSVYPESSPAVERRFHGLGEPANEEEVLAERGD
jgi:hypothetical protein